MESIKAYKLTPEELQALKTARQEIGPVSIFDFATTGPNLSKDDVTRTLISLEASYDALEWHACGVQLKHLQTEGVTGLPWLNGRLALTMAAEMVTPGLLQTLFTRACEALREHPGDCAPYLLLVLLKISASQRAHALEWFDLASSCPTINSNALKFVDEKLRSWIRTTDARMMLILPKWSRVKDFTKYKHLASDWPSVEAKLELLQENPDLTKIHDDEHLWPFISAVLEHFYPADFMQFDEFDSQSASPFSSLNANILVHVVTHLEVEDVARLGKTCKLLSNWVYTNDVAKQLFRSVGLPENQMETLVNPWASLVALKTTPKMIQYLPLLRSDPNRLFGIYEECLRRWWFPSENPRTPLLAPYIEKAFSALMVGFIEQVVQDPNTLGIFPYVAAKNSDFVEHLLYLIHSPPYPGGAALIITTISLFTRILQTKGALRDRTHSALMAHSAPVMLQLLPPHAFGHLAAPLINLLLSEQDRTHLAIGASIDRKLASQRTLWHFRLNHSTSFSGLQACYVGYFMLQFNENGTVEGDGQIGPCAVVVDGTWYAPGLVSTLEVYPVDGTFDGKILLLRGKPESSFHGMNAGLASLMDESDDSGKIPDHEWDQNEWQIVSYWTLERDVREVTHELEFEIAAECDALMPDLGTLLDPLEYEGEELEAYNDIDSEITMMQNLLRSAENCQWWCSSVSAHIEAIRATLTRLRPDVMEMELFDWSSEGGVMRGPYESEMAFSKRCKLLNAILYMVSEHRWNICTMLLGWDLESSIELFGQWCETPEPSPELQTSASHLLIVWARRLHICPAFVLCDDPPTIHDLMHALVPVLARTDTPLDSSLELFLKPAISHRSLTNIVKSAITDNPKLKTKKPRNRTATSTTTTFALVGASALVSVAVVAIIAYTATRWFKSNNSKHTK